MVEHITIIGNVSGTPEKRDFANGGCVVNFRVGVTERKHDKATDTWVDGNTNWYAVSAYRDLGEHVLASFAKGDRVIVSGKLRLKSWEVDGRKGLTAELDADGVGHELRFGTSTFHKIQRPSAGATTARESAPSEVDSAEEVWAAPGADLELAHTGDVPF